MVPEPDVVPNPVTDDPASTSPVAPPPQVPAVLIEHARKVADEYRARTGYPIDPDTLRSRLGVPSHLADAIAAQLA
ncbi:hypothetical protein ABZV65_10065 [Streptomyces bauhiniae]|uniref:hypothetical protein n=1 Tax=Streptomyces bauhiniae TaxID=2340725 RepID=UPI0033B8D4D9